MSARELFVILLQFRRTLTSSALASRWAFALPELSPRSSSSFFSFFSPPPNMEKTEEEVTEGACTDTVPVSTFTPRLQRSRKDLIGRSMKP